MEITMEILSKIQNASILSKRWIWNWEFKSTLLSCKVFS